MKKLKIDDFTSYKFLSGIEYSADGKHLCFMVKEAETKENSYNSNLWLYNNDYNKYFQLTSANKDALFCWLDDNENILFASNRSPEAKKKTEDGEIFTDFYEININGGEATKAFTIPKKVSWITQLDEDNYLYTATYDFQRLDTEGLTDEEKIKQLEIEKENKDYEVLDEIPFWSNGEGFSNKKRTRLYTYNINLGSSEELTDGYLDVSTVELNHDRKIATFIAREYEDKMELKNDIYLYDLVNRTLEKITPSTSFTYGSLNFLNTEELIVSGSDRRTFGLNENNKFYLLNIHSGERSCITPTLDLSLGNTVGSDCRLGGGRSFRMDGTHLYFISTEQHSSHLNRIDAHGTVERIIVERGSVDCYDVHNGNVMFCGLREQCLQELYRLDGEEEYMETDFNQWLYKERILSNPEKTSMKTAEGIPIEGWLLKPVDYDEGKKYPAILNIHGGPKTVYGEVLYHEMQFWANHGYVVFYCNPRGSDGRGNKFADIRGKYGSLEFEDLMKFTDHILTKHSFIDKERVGVTGGSYGGFMTNWIIGHTSRFKAAASQRSISNWTSMACTSDIGYFFADDQIGYTPWENQEKLWDCSPLKYANQVTTPTLFIHSENDYRCWIDQGYQMFTALKYHDIDARMVVFKEENHELSRGGKPKHRLRRLQEITDWFDKYLK